MDLIEMLDEIDAAIFTGDSLKSEVKREAIKEHADRWLRAIKEHYEHMSNQCPKCGLHDATFERSSGYAGFRCKCGNWFYA